MARQYNCCVPGCTNSHNCSDTTFLPLPLRCWFRPSFPFVLVMANWVSRTVQHPGLWATHVTGSGCAWWSCCAGQSSTPGPRSTTRPGPLCGPLPGPLQCRPPHRLHEAMPDGSHPPWERAKPEGNLKRSPTTAFTLSWGSTILHTLQVVLFLTFCEALRRAKNTNAKQKYFAVLHARTFVRYGVCRGAFYVDIPHIQCFIQPVEPVI